MGIKEDNEWALRRIMNGH